MPSVSRPFGNDFSIYSQEQLYLAFEEMSCVFKQKPVPDVLARECMLGMTLINAVIRARERLLDPAYDCRTNLPGRPR